MRSTKGMQWIVIYVVIIVVFVMLLTSHLQVFSSKSVDKGSPNQRNYKKLDDLPPGQQTRRENLEKLCRSHLYQDPSYVQEDPYGLQYYAIRSGLFHSIWVDDNRKLLFCKVHKVASTVWRTALVNSSPLAKADLKDTSLATEHNMQHAGLRSLGLMTLAEVTYRLKHFRKVIFVRHPLKRILSAYRDRVLAAQPDQNVMQHILRFLQVNVTSSLPNHNITFEEFVSYVAMTLKEGGPDPHWASFSSTCLPCLVSYDFIGKLETSKEDFAYVIKHYANMTSFPSKLQGPSSRDQNKRSTDDVYRKYYKQLPPDLIRHLVELYRTDFDLFGYDAGHPFKV